MTRYPLMGEWLSKEHRILEKGMMEFRPFGKEPTGKPIRDISGLSVCANVEYLQEVVTRTRGAEAGPQAVHELVRLLNERLPDRAYHVTPEFLRNPWHSYSNEFVAFLAEFCVRLSGDRDFQSHMGREKFLSPIIQPLGRPFSVRQIYKLFAHFAGKYARDSMEFQAVSVAEQKAVLRLRFKDRAYRQFGPYVRACAEHVCQATKAAIASVPERVHHLPVATVVDRACIAEGDDYCEWEFTWTRQDRLSLRGLAVSLLAGASVYAYLHWRYPEMIVLEKIVLAACPLMIAWLASMRYRWKEREQLMQEQLNFHDARFEDLRAAYMEREQGAVDLRQKVMQLSTLHRVGLIFNATLERETVLDAVLRALVTDLHYDRAILSFYDAERKVAYGARIIGVPEEIAAYARSLEVPVHDPATVEGTVLLRGMPMLISDPQNIWDRLHPYNQHLMTITGAKSVISVPLKVKDRVIGSLTVNRTRLGLTRDDLDVMVTVANQVAIALDNAEAYSQITALNAGLEGKVRERTAVLEQFLARVSHDLRTPLTSIRGFVENMLSGTTGSLTDKQQQYLTRVVENSKRLGRLVDDLLKTLVNSDRTALSFGEVNLPALVLDLVEQIRPLALGKRQRMEVEVIQDGLRVWADADKLSRIMTNLLDNAVKYTGEDGRVLVKVEAADPHFAKVSVVDTGEGMPEDMLARLSDPTYRMRRPETRGGSHRLGLSIVKELVGRQGGVLTVRSETGKGSEFAFTVPLCPILEGDLEAAVKRWIGPAPGSSV